MKCNKGPVVKIICFVLLSFVFSHRVLADQLNVQLQRVTDKLRQQMDAPAFSLGVSVPGERFSRVFISGTMRKGGHVLMDTATLFQAGSVAKSFTAIIVLQLEGEGKLNIHDKLGKWLPNFKKWKQITIKQLLNQTSGIYNYSTLPKFRKATYKNPKKRWKPKALVYMAYHHSPYFKPGDGWHYSDTNYVLLGMIINRITHHSVKDEMNWRLLGSARLNLLNTYYWPKNYPRYLLKRIAHGYGVRGRDFTQSNMSMASAAGAIISNSRDLVRWGVKFFSGDLLSPKQIQEMFSLVSQKSGQKAASSVKQGYGLGVFKNHYPVGDIWFVPGFTYGYQAVISQLNCTGLTVSYTMSQLQPDLQMSNHTIFSKVYRVLLNSPLVRRKIKRYQREHLPIYCSHLPRN